MNALTSRFKPYNVCKVPLHGIRKKSRKAPDFEFDESLFPCFRYRPCLDGITCAPCAIFSSADNNLVTRPLKDKNNVKRKVDSHISVVPVLVLLLVALWFILRCDLLCVFPCVILFLCFSVLLVLRLPRLGRGGLVLVLFVRLFGLCLFRFVGFLFILGSGKGCGL